MHSRIGNHTREWASGGGDDWGVLWETASHTAFWGIMEEHTWCCQVSLLMLNFITWLRSDLPSFSTEKLTSMYFVFITHWVIHYFMWRQCKVELFFYWIYLGIHYLFIYRNMGLQFPTILKGLKLTANILFSFLICPTLGRAHSKWLHYHLDVCSSFFEQFLTFWYQNKSQDYLALDIHQQQSQMFLQWTTVTFRKEWDLEKNKK